MAKRSASCALVVSINRFAPSANTASFDITLHRLRHPLDAAEPCAQRVGDAIAGTQPRGRHTIARVLLRRRIENLYLEMQTRVSCSDAL